MGRSAAYSQSAGSLVTVAIASLGGPVSAIGAALTELVRFGRSRFEAGSDERDLWHAVVGDVEAVAASERIDPLDVLVGLDTATAAVARHGLTLQGLVGVAFDPDAAAGVVIAGARSETDSGVGNSPYETAERAIRAVYYGVGPAACRSRTVAGRLRRLAA